MRKALRMGRHSKESSQDVRFIQIVLKNSAVATQWFR
jgi:hypothetical protein